MCLGGGETYAGLWHITLSITRPAVVYDYLWRSDGPTAHHRYCPTSETVEAVHLVDHYNYYNNNGGSLAVRLLDFTAAIALIVVTIVAALVDGTCLLLPPLNCRSTAARLPC